MDVIIMLLIIIAAYILLGFVAFILQDYFLFHPEKLSKNFEFKYSIPFEEVVISGVKESIIDSLHFKVKNAKKVVFYFKGNTKSIKGWAKFAKDFTSKGFNFFIIDYPGFGKSTGQRNEQMIYENAKIAYNWLNSKYDEMDIIIYGRSLGAGFAAYIASQFQPRMLILDSPFYSFNSLARYYTRILPLRHLLKYKIPLNEFVDNITCPVFIIHGDKDRTIPYKNSLKIVNIAPDKIKLFTIEGARHKNLTVFPEYHEILNKILYDEELYNKYLPK